MVEKLPHLPDEHHFAIASVSVRSAHLDYHIERVIELALRNQPRTAEFLLKNLGADRIVGVMINVLLDAFPEEEEALNNLKTHINCVRAERNEVIHWQWGHQAIDDKMLLHQSRPFREKKMKYVKVEDIQRVADEAYEAARALIRWQSLLGERLRQASREKP